MKGLRRDVLFAAVLVGGACVGTAAASAASLPTLPLLAADPPPPPSIWQGFHVGSEVFAISRSGGRGGGFGGDVYAGYDKALPNHFVLGVQGGVGYSPALFGQGLVKGYDFGVVDARLGYDLGRVMPYMTGGLVLARPHLGPGLSPSMSDAASALLGGTGNLDAAPRVGAGIAYAITPNLSIDVGVSVGRGPAALSP